ncbi:MBL fold metallo-hydrolase [Chryseosolibacter indicus]|uniref:MBL fold metallo-hydrolase n=1 Tax=Chryseosolibacter indicus TaxID=2782351 RepID=A0ABS5VP03_9BACT|nr:MBL fold metallo-hydrolase [Chryseosolibacter indicus]MBT1703086.1 MBL fold metallo-hydrolase [Chryseosolibacter indicus]
MLLFVLAVIVATVTFFISTGVVLSAPKHRGPITDHFDGKRFSNPTGIKEQKATDVVRWMLTRKKGPWKEDKTSKYGNRPLDFYKDGIRITYVNHTTFLIQVDGINILTDPIWSRRASPFSWTGPKRMRLPGIKFEDLPRIHLVLLSHNHYDHLDVATMRMVFGAHHPKILTPLGVKAYLDKLHVSGSTDLDWWNEQTINEKLSIQCVPAQHFSGRGLTDRNGTLWCGYVIKSSYGNIYFAGDTGYNDTTFKDIGAKAGPFKVSIIPIGAFKPVWFMSPIHCSPEEAVKIHFDTNSEVSIASHFGTFALADDGLEEPVMELHRSLVKYNLAPSKFLVLKEGDAEMF